MSGVIRYQVWRGGRCVDIVDAAGLVWWTLVASAGVVVRAVVMVRVVA